MKSTKHINSLHSLEKEIYRLQLASKELTRLLEKDQDHLRDNFFKLAKNSIKKERNKVEDNSSFIDHLLNNDRVKEAVSGITDRITDHTTEAINHLVDRLFQKHK